MTYMTQPDSAGIWKFRGYINYARGADPTRIVPMIVRVFWGTVTGCWQTVDLRYGIRPAYMLLGTWVKL